MRGLTALLAGSHADRLIVVSRVSQLEPLPSAHLQQIERVPGVRRATLVGAFPAVYQDRGNDLFVLATDPDTLFEIYPDWHVSPDQLEAMSGQRTGALVGEALMKAYGWKLGDRVPLRTSVAQQDGSTDWNFEIVGTFAVAGPAAQENRIIVNYAYFDEARMFDKGRAFAFIASIDDPLQLRAGVRGHRCALRELAGRDADPERDGIRAVAAPPAWRRRRDGERHRGRSAVHAAVPDRQHDAPGGA